MLNKNIYKYIYLNTINENIRNQYTTKVVELKELQQRCESEFDETIQDFKNKIKESGWLTPLLNEIPKNRDRWEENPTISLKAGLFYLLQKVKGCDSVRYFDDVDEIIANYQNDLDVKNNKMLFDICKIFNDVYSRQQDLRKQHDDIQCKLKSNSVLNRSEILDDYTGFDDCLHQKIYLDDFVLVSTQTGFLKMGVVTDYDRTSDGLQIKLNGGEYLIIPNADINRRIVVVKDLKIDFSEFDQIKTKIDI